MNKKIFGILIMLIMFSFIFITDVNAINCNYGTRDSSGAWNQMVKFEVDDYNKIILNRDESEYLSSVDTSENYSTGIDSLIGYKYIDNDGANDTYVVLASLYSNKNMYDAVKKNCVDSGKAESECGCPPTLNYKKGVKGINWKEHTLIVYNDELALQYDVVKNEMKDDNPELGILVEERYKDEPLEKIVIGGCPTYTYAMNELKSTMSSKGCSGNAEYDRIYADIAEKCETFRSSHAYASDDATPASCSKECANLNDEVHEAAKEYCEAGDGKYCGSLGNKIINWIFKVFKLIRYGLPAVVIILSILDYIKALASEDDGEMKKVNKRFMFRLIAVVLLFVVPFIIDFILGLFNIPGLSSSNPFCAK